MLINSTLSGQDLERNGFIGTMLGPSITIGEFASHSTFFDGYAKPGINLNLMTFGYKIWNNIGITSSLSGMANPIDYYGRKGMWGIGSLMAGPMYSINLGGKAVLDLKVMSGLVYESRDYDADNHAYAFGLGYDAGMLLRYNFAREWCFLFNIDGFFTSQDIQPSRDPEVSLINLSIGVGYRLK